MTEFKPGDRVEYVGASISRWIGQEGTYVAPSQVDEMFHYIDWDSGEKNAHAIRQGLRHVTPAPSVITIDRATLPEVREAGSDLFIGGGRYNTTSAARHRECALEQPALAEHLEARETAEKGAERAALAEKVRIQARRDAIAKEIARDSDWNDWQSARFDSHQTETQEAIKRLVTLADKLENTK